MIILLIITVFLLGYLPPLKALQTTNFKESKWILGFSMILLKAVEVALGILIAAVCYYVVVN